MVGLFEPAGDPKQATHPMHTLFSTFKLFRHALIAVLLSFAAGLAVAQSCATSIESDDALRYDPNSIEIPLACKTFTVTLKHAGRLPKLAMGHNWVLAKLSDLDGVARTGMLAGAENSYVDPKDTRVLAHTGVVGGGESSSVTFDTEKLLPGERYGFVCTFAGHSPVMRGEIVLK
jgi:azurin